MIISNEKLARGVDIANTFVARDDDKRVLGTLTITLRHVPLLFPDMPKQLVIRAQGENRALDVLYGAAVARARLLAARENNRARVYAEVEANNKNALDTLRTLGFKNADGIMRMYRRVNDMMNVAPLPDECTIVRDYLADPIERKFFLERYNALYDMYSDEDWLDEITEQPNFARILMVSPVDLCGEALVWTEDDMGVIGIIQTAKKWRRRGVARYLLEDARLYFASLGIAYSQMDVWLRAPGALPLARRADYAEGEMLVAYPELTL